MEAPVSLSLSPSLCVCLSICLSVFQGQSFSYYPNPEFFPLNREAPNAPYRFKPGGVIAVEVKVPQEAGLPAPIKYFTFPRFHGNPQGQDLTRAISRQEVTARLGDEECEVKTLDNTHLYCEPPEIQPTSVDDGSELPSLKVRTSTCSLRTRTWTFHLQFL